SLREEGALDVVAKLKIPVMLVYERPANAPTLSEFDKKADLVAEISEFFFERIDACLSAGINRHQLMLDPTVDSTVPTNLRLKLLGRLTSFRSFGLPLALSMPAILPSTQDFLSDNRAIGITLALFATQHGVSIIRTEHVSEMTMSIAAWQLASQQAKPFNLSRGIISRFKKLRDKIRVHKSQA
nr:dihydropteroate synthase [Succinivibrio sp.]